MYKLLLSFVIFISLNVSAQKGNIRGFVYDKSSGEPIMFCNVFLKGTNIGASTDINGMYNIAKVDPKKYTLTAVSYTHLTLPTILLV